jgi:two-component system, OmpR family, sensor kinase
VFRSLRFRLPALFLAGILLTGLVTTAIAFKLFEDYTRDQKISDLRREAAAVAALYSKQAQAALEEDRPAPSFQARELERASGNKLFIVGTPIFLQNTPRIRRLPQPVIDEQWRKLLRGRPVRFEFTPPNESEELIAIAYPIYADEKERGRPLAALVVATSKGELRSQLVPLLERLAIAFAGGVLIAAGLAAYLSGRITRPVRRLANAADEVAEGRYEVAVPDVAGRDEIADLAASFGEMARRLAEAEELERNFLMTVSHELRTPLTAIRGHVEALREGLAEDPAARAASLDVVAAESARLERLVGDVLDLAKLDARRFTVLREEVDMGRLVDQAYAAFGEEAKKRGIDYVHSASAEPVIVSDGDRVLQIITNLLANAFRWTPDGGRVGLELAAENGKVQVVIEDTGPGIRAEEQERIFRPFWTHDGMGTGLGLAIARELALALGGEIELDTKLGEGSRFVLVLPSGSPQT